MRFTPRGLIDRTGWQVTCPDARHHARTREKNIPADGSISEDDVIRFLKQWVVKAKDHPTKEDHMRKEPHNFAVVSLSLDSNVDAQILLQSCE